MSGAAIVPPVHAGVNSAGHGSRLRAEAFIPAASIFFN
jgi:hypothetical protein